MRKTTVILAALMLAVLGTRGAEARVSAIGPDLSRPSDWRASDEFSRAEGNVLITDVPAGKGTQQRCMERVVDMTPYRGKTVTFLVKYRSIGVSRPPEAYNGIKFMLKYKPSPESDFRWPGGNGMYGDSDGWQWTSFSETFPAGATSGTLIMGLQNSHGRVEFDLSTLQAGTLFTPEQRVNLDWKVRYPAEIAGHCRLRGVMSPGTIRYEDIRTLKEWNVNLIRAQLSRNWGKVGTELDLEEYDRWLNGKLDDLERAMDWAKEAGIKFVIDLHCLPGGRNLNSNMRMFAEKKYGDHFIEVWKRIASRFKDHPQLYAYDLVNEPLQSVPAPEEYDYWNLQRRAAEAVRKIDGRTPIMIESNMADKPETFAYLSPLAMDNIIYKVHMYAPHSFTHQRLAGEGPVVTYPGRIDGEMWDRERIRRELKPVIEFQKRHNCKIYVGEFSAIAWAPGAEKYLNDCIEVFEELGWDWSYHAFREWNGWSLEHEGDNPQTMKPAGTTPRREVLLKYFKRNEKVQSSAGGAE